MLDVIIIGAGVSGLSQALALSQSGLQVAVIDQGPQPGSLTEAWDSRVFALTRASQQALQAWQVWPKLISRRIARFEHMNLAWLGQPDKSVHLSASMVAEADLGHVVEQSVLREALLEACQQQDSCHFYWQQHWQKLQASDQGASIVLASGHRLQAALLIAADGASSLVRQHLGVQTLSWSEQAKAIVTTLECDQPHGQTARQWFLDGGTLALLPLASPRVCSLVWSLPIHRAEAMMTFSDAGFARSLYSHTDGVCGQWMPLSQRLSFPLQSLVNDDFAVPGVAFIADAAHVIHPLAGQGLNLGLADTVCLTSILTKAKRLGRPLGHTAVLKPYARARRSAALQTVALMTLLEKGGRFSAHHASLFSRLASSDTLATTVLKYFSVTFALHSLTK